MSRSAIMIVCLASYRSLFNKQNVHSRKYNNKNSGHSWPGSSNFSKHAPKPSGHSAFVEAGNGPFAPIENEEDDTPLQSIRVRQDVKMYESPV